MAGNIKSRIHKKLLDQSEKLVKWYHEKLKGAYIPFYASFDIRDAGFKIGNVDGNIFPAGFNNICQMDKDQAPEIASEFFNSRYPKVKYMLILAEDHFRNVYYWDNVITIREILIEAGYKVDVGTISTAVNDFMTLKSFSGHETLVYKVWSKKGQLQTRKGVPDLVITNNDFSKAYSEIDFSGTEMNPLKELGWYQRKKHSYFNHYNRLICEFTQFIGEDPWLFEVPTERFSDFNIADKSNHEALSFKVDKMIKETKKKYREHNIDEKPYVFIKNNSGTYGLGVVEINSGENIRNLNYKLKRN